MTTARGGTGRGDRAALLLLLLFVASRCLVPMDETDLFYNLRLGEIILHGHTVPRSNLLSFTHPDYPDPNLAWVFQIVLALVHRWGGIPATVLLKTGFVLATFALLFVAARARGASAVVAALALALAAWAAEPRFVERPHLVTFLGLATLTLALERAEQDKAKLLWACVPLGLLWANGNSCFFFCPVVLLLYGLGALHDGKPRAGRRALVVAACEVPLLFATPSRGRWFGYVVNHFRMPSLRPLQEYRTAEWPLDGPFFILVALVAAVSLPWERWRSAGVAVAAGAPANMGEPQRRARALRHLLPVLVLAVLGARRIRFVAETALLGGPYLAARATTLLAAVTTRRPGRLRDRVAALALAGLGALAFGPRLRALAGGQPLSSLIDLSLEDGLVPLAAIRWLDEHGLRDHLYNDLEVGSYLAWEGWPRHRVFQDPRINAYPPEWHAQLRRIDLPRPVWEDLLAHHGVEAALITFPGLNPRAALFDLRRWALVYRTDEALIFVRRTPAHAAMIREEELPFTFVFRSSAVSAPAEDSSAGVSSVLVAEPPLDAEGPVAPACVWAGRVAEWAIAQADFETAARELDRALGAGPPAPGDGSVIGALRETAEGFLPPALRSSLRAEAGALALRLGHPERAVTLLEGLPAPEARTNRGFALLATLPPPARLSRARPGAAESVAAAHGGLRAASPESQAPPPRPLLSPVLPQALAEFRGAREVAPDNAEAAFGEALVLWRLGRERDAYAALRAFLLRWPNHMAAPEARRLLAGPGKATARTAPGR